MATAEPTRRRRLLAVAPALGVLALAVGVGVVRWQTKTEAPALEPLAVTATSQYQFQNLSGMVHSADLVVRARVEASSRGRVVGTGDAAVLSRVVTLRVEEVLAGSAPSPTVLVEEEGWLPDGTPIEVNGLARSHEGMEAIWFLDRLPEGDLPGYLVINHQGRYVIDGGHLEGADHDDSLIRRLEGLDPTELATQVRHLAG